MSDDTILSMYLTLIDGDLARHGRVVLTPKEDAGLVGVVADREFLDKLGDACRAGGHDVAIDAATGALEIRSKSRGREQ
jgi:hypothetical protein